MTHDTIDYAKRIRERGYRLTPQRRLILDTICARGGHCTVDEVYELVKAESPDISLATVYRTLDFLCDMRLIVAADMGKRRIVYEIVGKEPHHHLICRACGATIQIGHDVVQEFFDRLEAEHDFTADMEHIALFGLCAACREEKD
jgi:Fur family ferric uptake transcriptional regulator